MDIDIYDDDCEEEDISSKEQKYTHLDVMEEMDVMIFSRIDFIRVKEE